jgi:hypothetical protein
MMGEHRVADGECAPRPIGRTAGFLVADVRGRPVGRVVAPMYGTSALEPDALAVRSGVLRQRHYLVPAAAIEAIDDMSRIVGLRLGSEELQRFL